MPADTDEGPESALLALALSRPADALAQAGRVLQAAPGDVAASFAHQAIAVVLRDRGQMPDAIAALRRAMRSARRGGGPDRVADVEATLGATLGMAGRTAEGLTSLERAVAATRGVAAGRVLLRRAFLLRILGRHDDALADLRRSIALLRAGGDTVWEARARNHRFLVYAELGQAARADRDLAAAIRLFAAAGQDLESAMAVHSRADVAYQRGDLPAALRLLDEAQARHTALGVFRPALAIDRAAVLLAAGLATEALATTEATLHRYRARGGDATKRAELLFGAAVSAQAAGLPDRAAGHAAAAGALFARQGRARWRDRAAFVALQVRLDAGAADPGLPGRVSRLADRLERWRAPEAPAAHLLAGRLAVQRGRTAAADRHFAHAAAARHRGPSFGQATGWLAQALRAEARGATAAALVACRHGLRAAGEHQQALAPPELRVHAAAHGTALAGIAQRHAVRRGDARMLLGWSERWRAGALAVPPVRPPDDTDLAADLAALRGVMRRLAAGRAAGAATEPLEQQRRRLEAAIRDRTRRTGADARPATDGAAGGGDLGPLLDGLDGHRLVELTAVDGRLYAVTVVGRRVRMHAAGTVADAAREVDLARFALGRLAHGRGRADGGERLRAVGRRLQEVLLGTAAADLGDAGGPVVVVPPARLHAVPWALLPALRCAPVVVAPSAATWLRAGDRPMPRRRRVVLVAGPGLPGVEQEVAGLAERYPDARTLRGREATAESVLAALDGAWTAHLAAHGCFRADNPLFSALSLDDGPLTVYDLGRLRRAPRRLVLSSCESAVAAPAAADELLGMVTALVPLGTASLLASVVQVNDVAAAPLMVAFHDRLLAGDTFGAALRSVRAAADAGGDPVAVATALSFVALGR
ncbi:CHAT domain-containing protein [Dactylosporangium sp. NPDC051541]|uniref:CHAT domain-containing protein n=1 Tax=Dactylosporangium sp. NPDC051541 TaxID=3363977 RepID=UPI0037AED878